MWALLILAILLPLGVSLSIMLIHVNSERVRIAEDAPAWRNTEYRSELHNLLGLLRQHGWKSAWPRRDGVWSIYWYEWRLRRLVLNTSTPAFRLVEWHLNCWFHLRKYQLLLDFALASSTVTAALPLAEKNPEGERDRYLDLIRSCREKQDRLEKLVCRQFGSGYLTFAQPILTELRRVEILFEEHGYHVHEGFALLASLEEARSPVHHVHE